MAQGAKRLEDNHSPACIIPACLWLLAVGAEIAAAVSDGTALDGCAADGTWLAAAVSYMKIIVCSAQLPIGPFIGINAGTFAVNG